MYVTYISRCYASLDILLCGDDATVVRCWARSCEYAYWDSKCGQRDLSDTYATNTHAEFDLHDFVLLRLLLLGL